MFKSNELSDDSVHLSHDDVKRNCFFSQDEGKSNGQCNTAKEKNNPPQYLSSKPKASKYPCYLSGCISEDVKKNREIDTNQNPSSVGVDYLVSLLIFYS
jgi:hypothetical protein